LILALVLYEIFRPLFNLDAEINYLNRVYVIRTDLISISVFSVACAIYVFILLLSLINVLKHAAYFYYIRRNREVEAGSLRAIVLNVGILIVILISLSLLGLTWKALLPIAGALGIGIGIGLQEIMNNYISGFILLFSKKLKVGDIVEMEGNAGRAIGNTLETIYGRVKSIDILSTVIGTTDGIEVVIPNSQFISQQIVNYSLSYSYIRVRIPFGVSYSSDPNAMRDILLNVVKENPLVLESPAPSVWFSEMGESALVFHLLCWVNIRMLWKINPLVSDIYFKGWYELEKAGVVIPFPQRDVWFKNNLKIEVEKETADKFSSNSEFNNIPGITLTKKTDLPD
jgi:small-conductance mechanosensitive channel